MEFVPLSEAPLRNLGVLILPSVILGTAGAPDGDRPRRPGLPGGVRDHGSGNRWDSRRITKSPRTAWTVGPDEEVFLPIDRYWAFPEEAADVRAIIRLRYDRERDTAVLAVAGVDSDRVDALLKRLIADSIATSIYRARLLTLSYETGTRDEFGDVEKAEHLRVSFTVAAPVSRREFVVDDGLYKLLWRNVVDLHARREVLKTHGVPISAAECYCTGRRAPGRRSPAVTCVGN